MQHEVGADFKVELPTFSGRHDDWTVWSARFGAYAELVRWTAVLEVAEAHTAPITMVGESPHATRLGKIICAVLLTKTEGTGFSIVHLTPRGAGAEGRLLHTEYTGSSIARLGIWYAMWYGRENTGCRCERWQGLPDVTDRVGNQDQRTRAGGDDHGSRTRCSEVDASQPLEQRRNVDTLKLWIRESSYATPGLFQGSVPMRVSSKCLHQNIRPPPTVHVNADFVRHFLVLKVPAQFRHSIGASRKSSKLQLLQLQRCFQCSHGHSRGVL